MLFSITNLENFRSVDVPEIVHPNGSKIEYVSKSNTLRLPTLVKDDGNLVSVAVRNSMV